MNSNLINVNFDKDVIEKNRYSFMPINVRLEFQLRLLLFAILFLFSIHLFAQIDPTASVLLKPGPSDSQNPNLDSGRYTVKPNGSARNLKSEQSSVPQVTQPKTDKKIDSGSSVKNEPTIDSGATSVQSTIERAKPSTATQNNESTEKGLIDSIQETLIGGDEETLSYYKDQSHPEDPRQNILNISIAPIYLYVNSSSDYWYRDYHSSGRGLSAKTDLWLSPFFGLEVNYATSLVAELESEPNSNKVILVDHQFIDYGFLFRKYSSLARKSPWFEIGFKFSEYKLIIPKDEENRIRLNNRGFAVSFDINLPISNTTHWRIGSSILPKMDVSEESTGIDVKSGKNPTSYAVEFRIGQQFSIDKQNQIFWQLSHRFDKSIYEGTANQTDPIKNATPSGVSVDSGISLFKFGYTWGD